nr:hypothetical protein [Methylobrevis pamukkalensis]
MANGVAGRCDFRRTSWLDGIAGPFGLIVSNPPYIRAAEIDALARRWRCTTRALLLMAAPTGLSPTAPSSLPPRPAFRPAACSPSRSATTRGRKSPDFLAPQDFPA